MLNNLFNGVFQTEQSVPVSKFLLCVIISLIIGAYIATIHTIKNKYSKSFVTTLAIMPAVVCVIIMMVNGNIGVGVAIAGAFSLVRFRSLPGTAKEIGAILIAMGSGIMTGMGYVGLAVVFVLVVSAVMMVYEFTDIWTKKSDFNDRSLTITIPESLDYTGVFDDLLENYTEKYTLKSVKTTNMGSLFKLNYIVVMKQDVNEKKFIDELRCRNGNLEISMAVVKEETPNTL